MRRMTRPPPALPEGNPDVWKWSERLLGLTPIVRGGSQARGIDVGRPVRGPSIRGQLRAWWRATHPTDNLTVLRSEERQLFGSVHGGRVMASQVRVGVRQAASRGRNAPSNEELGYGLWPLRNMQNQGHQLHTNVSATVDVSGPVGESGALQRAVEAWLLCSGLGSRTRRGYGVLWPRDWPRFESVADWASRIMALSPGYRDRGWPSLGCATFLSWKDVEKPTAELAVLDALERFRAARGMREDVNGTFNGNCRLPAIQNQDWPAVRDGQGSVDWWPALGLPIPVRSSEPQRHFQGTRIIKPVKGNRLPSPILVRPVPLASGRYAPALIVLRLWAFPQVNVRNAAGVGGTVNQPALGQFVNFLVAQSGAQQLGVAP